MCRGTQKSTTISVNLDVSCTVHKYSYSHTMYVHIFVTCMYTVRLYVLICKWMIELFGIIANNQVIFNQVCEEIT